ncbi:MAG: hypothetical protein R6U21_07495, partial [Thermoplasmatota archaeon]
MKKTFFSFLIVGLLLSTGLISVVSTDNESSNKGQIRNCINFPQQSIHNEGAEPPEAEIGDRWKYNMEPVVLDADGSSYSLDGIIEFEDLTLEVEDIASGEYKVHFFANITGGFDAEILGGMIKLSGEFLNKLLPKSRLEGDMVFRSLDLGI